MREGDVLLAPLRQADGSLKDRPALFLMRMPPFEDFLVCGISTQLQQAVPDFDETISPTDADFRTSGLKAASLIRLGYLAVLPRSEFKGRIGSVSAARRKSGVSSTADEIPMVDQPACRIAHTDEARATSRPSPSSRSHSRWATARPRRMTRAWALSRPSTTGRK